ncbi:MEDS domain-containing protein [Halalkalibacter akibai]|uniref:3-ketoacyl-(Acyl-carrier-protein) reductase n=1 Tax=Halalkalibacter akibai (strain ATCC 43226 / DSM 21942 / CIP 109018 / JCM 9157 / 1139) TaxID=1236973 RepID=W4QW78_HALA3|nr:MEDS domain-containing protein [Halalkalibacter akibai]GAE36157.1 3-ketoacyl-(acyl-carrier-protein) reductase [Halalkalibacter akibai JCM 9157]
MNEFQTISHLTNDPSFVKKGSHILYMYNELDKYIENTVQFIYEGLKQGSIILLIESVEIFRRIKDRLLMIGVEDDDSNKVKFFTTDEFYFNGEEFDVKKAGSILIEKFQPYLDKGYAIRTWGKVPLPDQGSGLKQIITYECECEDFIFNKNITSVCSYHDLSTPACLQNELLKTHTH